jgi:hypothetical protein
MFEAVIHKPAIDQIIKQIVFDIPPAMPGTP